MRFSDTDVASYLMYPQVFLEFDRFRGHYGDVVGDSDDGVFLWA